MRVLRRRATGRCLASIVLVTLAACATPARRGIDLSDAQHEAAKDDSEKKKVLVAEEPPEHEADPEEETGPGALDVALALGDAMSSPVASAEAAPPEPTLEKRQSFSVVGTGMSFAGHPLESLAGFGLGFGYQPEPKTRLVLGGYFLDGALGSQGEGFTDFQEWAGEACARFYLTSDHTLLGVYFQVGGRMGLLAWDYASPVTVAEGGGLLVIEKDMLTTYSGFVGAGVAPLQLPGFHLGAGVNLGVRLYQGVTHEGFDNDIFPTVGYRQFYVEGTALF